MLGKACPWLDSSVANGLADEVDVQQGFAHAAG
jgi:hypothetical protein